MLYLSLMKKVFFIAWLAVFVGVSPALGLLKVEKLSGDGQSGIEGSPLREDFAVRVVAPDGKPAAGVPVAFSLISSPDLPSKSKRKTLSHLSGALSITGADGIARSRLNLGYPSRGTAVVTATTRDTIGDPVVFRAETSKRGWFLLLLFGLAGGLGIFLFGMFQLNDALQLIAGKKLREVLIKLTSSPFRGISTGFLVTFFNQSSTATTLLEVSLVSAGILTFYQTMAVTIGAEIGSTLTAQLIAFRLTEYAAFIAGAGFFVSFISKTKKGKHIGSAILGFGIMFLGMKIMLDLVAPLRGYEPFLEIMKSVNNPLLGIAAGLVFTLVISSSGATSGVVIALALAGAISLAQAIPIMLGAQIGTCFTVWLGSIGRGREGKQVALWHVFHQTAGVALVYPFLTVITYNGQPAWIHFITWFTGTILGTSDIARQVAVSHTLASVLNALVFFPLLPLMAKLFNAVFPAVETEKPFGPIYLDEGLLSTPPLALLQARKETVREGEIVLEMLGKSLQVFDNQDLQLSETVSLMDIRADVLRNAIVPYLTRIAQRATLNEEQSLQETELLYIAADFESIGDVVDKNIMPLARKKIQNRLWFSDEGWVDIVRLHRRVTDNLARAVEALRTGDPELAKLVVESKAEVNGYEGELRKRHIERLHEGLSEALETSSIHLDLLEQFRRVNSLTVSIAHSFLGRV